MLFSAGDKVVVAAGCWADAAKHALMRTKAIINFFTAPPRFLLREDAWPPVRRPGFGVSSRDRCRQVVRSNLADRAQRERYCDRCAPASRTGTWNRSRLR